jgi:hypothetical protein
MLFEMQDLCIGCILKCKICCIWNSYMNVFLIYKLCYLADPIKSYLGWPK